MDNGNAMIATMMPDITSAVNCFPVYCFMDRNSCGVKSFILISLSFVKYKIFINYLTIYGNGWFHQELSGMFLI